MILDLLDFTNSLFDDQYIRYPFFVSSPFLWNSIPYEILSASLNSFRSRLRYYLLIYTVIHVFVLVSVASHCPYLCFFVPYMCLHVVVFFLGGGGGILYRL